jgi:AcrR family transcriptional regulator
MPPETLTPERILEATEEVLRRYGPAKATVVDVARALGVSHGSVYRHFRTKAELREAVTQRWLDRTRAELEVFAEGGGTAAERLGGWLDGLFAAKRRKALSDPELFATFMALVDESSGTVARHIEEMTGQLARILGDGAAAGEFALPGGDVGAAARAVWDATGRFHDPVYAAEWDRPEIHSAFAAVRGLILQGLAPRRG